MFGAEELCALGARASQLHTQLPAAARGSASSDDRPLEGMFLDQTPSPRPGSRSGSPDGMVLDQTPQPTPGREEPLPESPVVGSRQQSTPPPTAAALSAHLPPRHPCRSSSSPRLLRRGRGRYRAFASLASRWGRQHATCRRIGVLLRRLIRHRPSSTSRIEQHCSWPGWGVGQGTRSTLPRPRQHQQQHAMARRVCPRCRNCQKYASGDRTAECRC